MKTTSQTIKKIPQVLYAVLLSIACVLFVILVVGTIIGLVRSRSSQPLINFGADVSANITPGSQAANTNPQSDDIRIYSGLERMRIPLADSSILILSTLSRVSSSFTKTFTPFVFYLNFISQANISLSFFYLRACPQILGINILA